MNQIIWDRITDTGQGRVLIGHAVFDSCLSTGRNYLTVEDDPVLAKAWDNEEDAVFDEMGES